MFYLLKSFIQMKILLNNNDLNEALYSTSNLGFVPTMGSLHKGHISLIKKSLKECKKTIVSIFINPTQFNDLRDFKRYPKNHKRDLSILRKLKIDFVYLPKKKHIYNFSSPKVQINKKDKILCAKFRKGHFEGVIDVMRRLTELIKPQKIFMGEKDFQQYLLVKKDLEKKNNLKVLSCKTIRHKNRIALSSRNLLLKKKELELAGKISKNLIKFKKELTNKKYVKKFLKLKRYELMRLYNVKIEYFELRNKKNLRTSNLAKNSKLFISYYINKIRLIDNY